MGKLCHIGMYIDARSKNLVANKIYHFIALLLSNLIGPFKPPMVHVVEKILTTAFANCLTFLGTFEFLNEKGYITS